MIVHRKKLASFFPYNIPTKKLNEEAECESCRNCLGLYAVWIS